MMERIRQRLDDLVEAIGLPKEKLCTYCWGGVEGCLVRWVSWASRG